MDIKLQKRNQFKKKKITKLVLDPESPLSNKSQHSPPICSLG